MWKCRKCGSSRLIENQKVYARQYIEFDPKTKGYSWGEVEYPFWADAAEPEEGNWICRDCDTEITDDEQAEISERLA